MAQQLQLHLQPLQAVLHELSRHDRNTLYTEIKSIQATYWREITQGGTGALSIERARELTARVC